MNFADLPLSALTQAINFTPAFLFECVMLAPRASGDLFPAALARFNAARVELVEPTISTTIATQVRDIEEAAELVGNRYVERGYLRDPAEAIADARTRSRSSYFTLVARSDETTLGTVTIGFDGAEGLFADEGNREALDQMRSGGARLCELVRLAVVEGTESTRVLAALFNAAYGLGRAKHATDLMIEVLPKHAPFYNRSFGFSVLGNVHICPRVGVGSVLLRLEIAKLSRRIENLQQALAGLPL